ncbi:hypothetical protein HMPREF2628_00500 [Streptococcus sp. HMSC063B03]|uniref:hypothetical protein n=1 Tax=Streptococcus sp. HMSC063B03 TaxID=1715107 RepID=UPI0008A86F7D|nr:hypothetical protein [Streptococcus sp. HMSC063B03]OHP91307.1 hypothetical protein HMPREF2628_00500 [Streptococcus sp. HMSC063B03]
MYVDIFKSKFSEADFDLENTETAIEKFQDDINEYIGELENDDYEIIKTEFKLFDDGRVIAIVVSD